MDAEQTLTPDRRRATGTVAWVLLAAVAYATLRYNVFKDVPWSDWPVYVVNKALALAALGLMVLSAVAARRPVAGRPPWWLMPQAGVMALIHVVLSIAILNPEYFGKLFREGHLTQMARISMSLGAAAVALMAVGAWQARGSGSHRRQAWLLGALTLTVGVHAALLGFAGWFTPSQWPGYLPPITLIAFLLGLAGVLAALVPRPPRRPGLHLPD